MILPPLKKEWINSDSVSAETPLVCLFDTMQLLYKGHTRVHSLIYIIKTLEKKKPHLSVGCVQTNRCVHRQTNQYWESHTHTSASWICMPVRPKSRGDNKSNFRHVCGVSRRHLSRGWMWRVGSEQSKQGHSSDRIHHSTPAQTHHPGNGQSTWGSCSVVAARQSLGYSSA